MCVPTNKPGICELWKSFVVDDDSVAHTYPVEMQIIKVY